MADESTIAREIRLARKRLKMNQAEFAKAIDASQGSVSKWESGREVPRLEAVEKIAQLSPEFDFAIQKREVRTVPVQRYVMDYIGRAPLRGFFMEGGSLEPYVDQMECAFLIGREWEGREFEAFLLEPRTERERQNGGAKLVITASFSVLDRLDDVHAAEYLVALSGIREGKEIYFLASPAVLSRREMKLWPSSIYGRTCSLPIDIGGNGRPTDPSCRVVGPVVCTMLYPRAFSPATLEPPRKF
ncbi:transcriptional regulator with XRE-family HTH domain [Rhizobium mesoamericanum]|uniref:helix-turn-helix domain-containing protein n=1 Tax=Rhizobium mesoamericanum TaxID=1079800 RepID=UPI002786CA64|nr:helix-turn-helix transcriptional regulator [Rhizobium mesoamericanum]MDQ0558709.1 transcriptional regulator with XRE-family HTH domain [Rhizobium mesoamericanum]